jgi:hypothetical protein
MSRYPGSGVEFLKGFIRAARQIGPAQYMDTLRTGKEPAGVWSLDPDKPLNFNEATARKLFPSHDLLTNIPDWSKVPVPFTEKTANFQKVANLLGSVGWVFRNLSAINAVYYKSMQEGAANAEAYIEAKKSGLSGEPLRRAIAEKLYGAVSSWENAERVARNEADLLAKHGIETSEREILLKTSEVVAQARAPKFNEEVERFAQSVSLTKPPTGIVGQVIGKLNGIADTKFPFMGKHDVRPFKLLFPFMRVMGNLINLSADYVPLTRLVGDGSVFNKNLGELERTGIIGRQLTGAVLAGTALGLAYAFKDDKNPAFWITGAGPSSPGQKETYRNSGAVPWSLKIGDTYISYAHTPLVFLFGGMGSLLDKIKYDPTYDASNIASDFGVFGGGAMSSMAHQSFLVHLGNVIDAILGEQGSGKVSDALAKAAVQTVKGYIPWEGALRTIARMADDVPSTYKDLKAKVLEGVPVAERAADKWLNVFGDPITKPWYDRLQNFTSERSTDPQIRWLADNGYGLTIPLKIEVPESKKDETLAASRSTNLGAEFSGVLTQHERTKLVETAGPRLRALVAQFSQEYGNSAHSDDVQKKLTHQAGRVIKEVEQELFIP